MFEGFETRTIETAETQIHLVKGGDGPPLLLLHGYPETHVMWHKTAPKLAEHFTVVVPDLRGYGDSGRPADGENHEGYSKRAMARDQVQVMEVLGFDRFLLAGHDRGGRVAHRLALDYADQVEKVAVLDIVPTARYFADTDQARATAYFHWFFLIQREPFPETMIENSLEFYLQTLLGKWGGGSDFVTPDAYQEYKRCMEIPGTIHTTCEDYRAGAGIDLEHDSENINSLVECPLLALWGAKGFVGKFYDPLSVWRRYAKSVSGGPVNCGHFIPEEAPEETISLLTDFFMAND